MEFQKSMLHQNNSPKLDHLQSLSHNFRIKLLFDKEICGHYLFQS